MRHLDADIQLAALPVLDSRQNLTFRGSVDSELVGHDHTGHVLKALEQFAEEPLGHVDATPALDEDVSTFPCWSTARQK